MSGYSNTFENGGYNCPVNLLRVKKTTFVWDGKSSNLHGREHLKFNTSSGKTRVWVWGSNSKFGWTRDHRSHRCSSSQSSNTTSDQRANGKAKTVTSQQSPTQKRESNTVKHLMESGSWIYDENWAGWLAISHESRSKHPKKCKSANNRKTEKPLNSDFFSVGAQNHVLRGKSLCSPLF